ncbi:MAG: hypothetical protein IT436_05055 [Phycisphaerales bacterium]|nr:hypothetical protein [Phycisphaerales bacterium]
MTVSEREVWARRLEAVAAPVLHGTPLTLPSDAEAARRFILAFADERGHRRGVDPFVLAAFLGVPAPVAEPSSPTPDVRAWAAVARDQDPDRLELEGSGPLLYGRDPSRESEGIETATEVELAVLHALWRRATRKNHPRFDHRAMSAARWAVATLQPDNATGHPWAVAVFIELWIASGDAEARLYAETLIHNSLVGAGAPDRFSAVLLLDSAWLLRDTDRGIGAR